MWSLIAAVMGSTTIDRFRYTIEQMPPAEYLAASYYERWLWAIEHRAAEQGILDGTDRPARVARPSPSTPTEQRYLVLPLRPAGTDDWDEQQLASLVTRNAMIGTGFPLPVTHGT